MLQLILEFGEPLYDHFALCSFLVIFAHRDRSVDVIDGTCLERSVNSRCAQ